MPYKTFTDENGTVYDLVPRTTTKTTTEQPKIKYRANGSVLKMGGFKNNEYFHVNSINEVGVCTYTGDQQDTCYFLSGDVFDTQEKAQAWADKRKIYYEIKLRLEQINAEEGWVADETKLTQVKYFVFINDHRKIKIDPSFGYRSTFAFCPKAKEYFESLPLEKQEVFLEVQCA